MVDNDARFRELMQRHGPGLRRLVASYARPGADEDDLAQDIAIAVWKALPTFRGESSERTFVFRIAQFRALTHVARRRGLQPSELSDELADEAPSPERVTTNRRDVERLFAALRALSLPHRQVLTLALEGLSHKEIGECLGTSPENVAVRLTRARGALRETMEKSR